MSKNQNAKQYDLEERTERFASQIRLFVKKLPRTISNREDVKQLIRSSGSIAANYIEANESLSKKDFFFRIKICRKETKESRLWLKLLRIHNTEEPERQKLINETVELMRIFGSMVKNK